MKDLIIIGASGHGKVVADIALKSGYKILGFIDDDKSKRELLGYRILGTSEKIPSYMDKSEFIIAIGNNSVRKKLSKAYSLNWATLIHPFTSISTNVTIGEGSVIMAGAIINSSAKIGSHCIINTGAIIEHDNQISDYVHLSPSVALGGTVQIGEETHIGIGAKIRNNITITEQCVIGAGGVVIHDIMESGVYAGVPVHRLKEHN